jgi:hypothetical protein
MKEPIGENWRMELAKSFQSAYENKTKHPELAYSIHAQIVFIEDFVDELIKRERVKAVEEYEQRTKEQWLLKRTRMGGTIIIK